MCSRLLCPDQDSKCRRPHVRYNVIILCHLGVRGGGGGGHVLKVAPIQIMKVEVSL